MKFLPPATKLGLGYVFTCVCDSVHRGVVSQHALQVISQYALQQVSTGVSQHALQVSRPTPRGKLRDLARGVFRPTPKGELRGLAWGSPGPHPGVCIPACTEADPPDGYCCRQYASYWKAFLFLNLF